MSGGRRLRLTLDEQEAADWERARQWAESTPDWSDALWRKINAGLGYQVVTRAETEVREPSDDDSRTRETAD